MTISGLVQHKNYGLAASESALWSYLLTGEFRLFWRELSSHYYCLPGWWPLLDKARHASLSAMEASVFIACRMNLRTN